MTDETEEITIKTETYQELAERAKKEGLTIQKYIEKILESEIHFD